MGTPSAPAFVSGDGPAPGAVCGARLPGACMDVGNCRWRLLATTSLRPRPGVMGSKSNVRDGVPIDTAGASGIAGGGGGVCNPLSNMVRALRIMHAWSAHVWHIGIIALTCMRVAKKPACTTCCTGVRERGAIGEYAGMSGVCHKVHCANTSHKLDPKTCTTAAYVLSTQPARTHATCHMHHTRHNLCVHTHPWQLLAVTSNNTHSPGISMQPMYTRVHCATCVMYAITMLRGAPTTSNIWWHMSAGSALHATYAVAALPLNMRGAILFDARNGGGLAIHSRMCAVLAWITPRCRPRPSNRRR